MNGENTTVGADGAANRRWLIGLGITVVFGVFGVVMALLTYGEHTPAPASADAPGAAAAPPAAAPAATASPAETTAPAAETPSRGRGKGRGQDQ